MTLSSEPGKGSRFAFAIDLPVAAPSPEIETLLAGRRALVVARSAVEAPALAACLADAGAASEIVPTVADAVVRLRGEATAFDIALVENRIGHDAADDLATLRDVVPDLPAVVLIEPGARGELDRLKRQGYAGYLVRPIRARSAVALLDTVLDGPDWDKEDDLADERVAPRLPRKVESRHVLLAEDNEINTLLARSVLERQGHRVTAVADGAAALAVYREAFVPGEAEPGEPIDLVLMDLHMPELDGIGATRAIRALEAEHLLARVPIVALTANAQADERERALAAGLDDYATKPIDPDRLARLVETWTGTGRERALARAG